MPENSHDGPTSDRVPTFDARLQDLRQLADATLLPFDRRSREELSLKLAGYDDEQIAKLLERQAATIRRAA
ncbi:MAG: hypothetical protein WBC44_03310 [Planctomycetaceae bacterium]